MWFSSRRGLPWASRQTDGSFRVHACRRGSFSAHRIPRFTVSKARSTATQEGKGHGYFRPAASDKLAPRLDLGRIHRLSVSFSSRARGSQAAFGKPRRRTSTRLPSKNPRRLHACTRRIVLPAGGLATYGGARLAGQPAGWESKVSLLAMLDARHRVAPGCGYKRRRGSPIPAAADWESKRHGFGT